MANSTISEDSFAKLISIAGRQRMLSQRVGFLFVTLNGYCEKGCALPAAHLAMLQAAIQDFTHGYAILRRGDPDQGLPVLQSDRVEQVLCGKAGGDDCNGETGQQVIDRFLKETREGISDLEDGLPQPSDRANRYSAYVLGPLLQVLQAIVTALETDFEDEMKVRRERRAADVDRVMRALQEIQKASKFSRMVALNAKISADRAGPHGQEFGALTEEIKKISNNITESSQDIIKHLDHV